MTSVDEPTRRDLTAADMDLFRHDATKPPHDSDYCEVTGCWVCRWEHNLDRLWADSRDEREYDRRAS